MNVVQQLRETEDWDQDTVDAILAVIDAAEKLADDSAAYRPPDARLVDGLEAKVARLRSMAGQSA